MNTVSRALVGAVAAGAVALVPATGAMAQDRHGRDRGISAGEIIAGAVVLGGIAAAAGSLGRGGEYRGDSRYYRNGAYGYYNGDPRSAVEQCVNAARQDAFRRGFGDVGVRQIRSVSDTRYGWKVKGDISVGSRGYANRGGYDYGRNPYGAGYRDARYGADYNRGYRGDPGNGSYDRGGYGRDRHDGGYRYGRSDGSFTCWIERARVSRIDYRGIRGL